MRQLYVTLKKGGWLWVVPQASDKDDFIDVVNKLKSIPVLVFDKKAKRSYTSINYLDELYKIAKEEQLDIYITDEVESYYDRWKLHIEEIKKARLDTSFQSEY